MSLENYKYNEDNAGINTTATQDEDKEASYIEKSAMALITIKKIATKTFSSGSEAIVLSVVNEEEAFANINLFVKGKTGEKMFGRNMFDGLIKILGLEKTSNVLEDIKGKQVLAALSAKQNGEFVNVEIKSFFFPATKLTSSETIKGETETKQYSYWLSKIKEEIATQAAWDTPEGGTADEDDDDFPF